CPPPASSLSCDGHQQNLHSFPTRRSSDLVDGGNILLVQVDAGGGLGRHRHAGECEWRQCHQCQGTLLGVSHSVGLPISSTRISSTKRPAMGPVFPCFLQRAAPATPRGRRILAAVLGPACAGRPRPLGTLGAMEYQRPPQLLAARTSFNE